MNNKDKSYVDRTHTVGSIWSIAVLLVLLGVPLAFCVHHNVWPALSEIGKGLLPVAVLFYPTAIIEILAYSPLLGAGGTYLSFTTGNISNLKLPCALAAMDTAKVKSNSDEGEVITTIAVATSAIVTTVIIAAFVLLFRPFIPKLTDPSSVLAPAFKQVMPALFGALGASYFSKHWKVSIAPIVILTIIVIINGGIGTGVLIPIGVVVSLVGALVMYKLKLL